jgi:capsular exopolysaccharide synthesis family protein
MARSLLRRQAQKRRAGDGQGTGALVTKADPAGTASEAYWSLRTNLLYAGVSRPLKVVLVTSPGHAEGKSTTCANLGGVLAQAGNNTLLIDADLRTPNLHEFFGVRNLRGVMNVLSGENKLSEVLVEPFPGLKVAPAGPIPSNPSEFLGSNRFAALVDEARRLFDYVILDSPPVGLVPDPLAVATQADAVLLVLDAQGTRKDSLRKAMRSLKSVGAYVLGTVVNNVEESNSARHNGHAAYR